MNVCFSTKIAAPLALLTCFFATEAKAQSDTCANALHLGNAGFVVATYDGSSATASGFDGGRSCPLGNTITHDQFWTYTAATAGYFSFDLDSISPGRRVSIHIGSDCLATCLQSSNTGLFGNHTLATVQLSAGDTVLVQLGGSGNPIASGKLTVTALANDCSNPTDLGSALRTAAYFDTSMATTSGFDLAAMCNVAGQGPMNQDLFFKYTVPLSTGFYEFRAHVFLQGQVKI